ncbi:MAG: T9SS C-terminal target domain-containing protein [Ignavibacteriae bacterium]|nr:MAG: T9SS C-terminal target domain-containing protein [Ignavibacteriota bacterium]
MVLDVKYLKNKIITKGMTTLFIFTAPMLAGNMLSVVRKSSSILEVQFQNTDLVDGLQFSLRSSSDIALSTPGRGDRVLEPSWIVESYKPNDSTVNVLILNLQQEWLESGSGSLIRLSYGSRETAKESYVTPAGVIVVTPQCDSLNVTVDGLRWSDHPITTEAIDNNRSFILEQNYPNPFNPSTVIQYQLSAVSDVRLSVYDMLGREVTTLVNGTKEPGYYNTTFDGSKLSSGIYFARIAVQSEDGGKQIVQIRKMLLTK